jgi:hypothetical protein
MDKPCPRIVFRYGSQDNQIREFLMYRKVVKNIMERVSEHETNNNLKQEMIMNYVRNNNINRNT